MNSREKKGRWNRFRDFVDSRILSMRTLVYGGSTRGGNIMMQEDAYAAALRRMGGGPIINDHGLLRLDDRTLLREVPVGRYKIAQVFREMPGVNRREELERIRDMDYSDVELRVLANIPRSGEPIVTMNNDKHGIPHGTVRWPPVHTGKRRIRKRK